MENEAFDYELMVWGRERIRAGDHSFAGFRLTEGLACLPEQGRVVELGCGGGRMLGGLRAARPGLEFVGLDLSRAALKVAGGNHPGVEFRHCPAPSAPLPSADGEFDVALVFDVLEHLPDPLFALTELARILRPGGALHLQVPCENDPLSLWRWLPADARDWKRDIAGHIQRFRRREIPALLAEAGFEVAKVRHSLHLVGNLADVATFAGMALTRRLRGGCTVTTGDLLAGGTPDGGSAPYWLTLPVRIVDALIWLEARSLARVPSWCLHVSSRRSSDAPPALSGC